MTEMGSYAWIKMLPDLVKMYNNTYHSTIEMKPVDVNADNEKLILHKFHLKLLKNQKFKRSKFKVGDRVRISKYKKIFTKGYLPNWTNEVFTIYKIKPTIPKTYILKDDTNNILSGGFYEEEISRSKIGDVFLIEKVLKRKGDKVFVRWKGFDKSYDSWVDKKNMI